MSGYIETRPYFTWNESASLTGYNRGWLEFKTKANNYGMQLAFDLVIPYDTASFSYASDNINISRLALWLGGERARMTAGKQSLYWGVGRIFRPLDIFNRVNYFEPGYERVGSNALLGYLALGTLSNFRAVVMPSGDVGRTLTGLRAGTNIANNDVGVTVMRRASGPQTIIGGELTGELLLGYWSEWSYTWEDTIEYVKVTAGLDYTFPLMIYAMVEYFFDGSGESEPEQYDYAKITAGERQTLGRQYLYASIGLLYNPFLRPSISTVINLDDGGFVFIPNFTCSVLDNMDLTIGSNYAVGSSESEFRNITPFRGAVYVWAKVYF
jgi:hypothetical protein